MEFLCSEAIPTETGDADLRRGPAGWAATRPLEIRDCGLADYREILLLQQQLSDQRREGMIADTVLLVEHHPVITLGARQDRNKLRVSLGHLQGNGIDLVNIRRGGGATAHNPGQLVYYPILNLLHLGLRITEYVRELEAIGAALLERLGLSSSSRKGSPGLWVGQRKIASIGVRVSRMTTYHGMAINIQNDLGIFDLIVPCGLEDVEMTSVLKETGKGHSMGRVKKHLAQLLTERFSTARE